ncbi:hypothetical protein, partial [Hymenobacter bucti]
MSPAITQELFTAYVQGTASAAEAATVRAWLAQPANQLLAQYWMGLHWEELAAQPAAPSADAPDYEALLTRLHRQLDLGQAPRLPVATAAPTWRR